jgi:hypothetical protein
MYYFVVNDHIQWHIGLCQRCTALLVTHSCVPFFPKLGTNTHECAGALPLKSDPNANGDLGLMRPHQLQAGFPFWAVLHVPRTLVVVPFLSIHEYFFHYTMFLRLTTLI